ncbi:reticulocyte-binding protein 2 a isoform X3, partial [Biomphalaria glabrata]
MKRVRNLIPHIDCLVIKECNIEYNKYFDFDLRNQRLFKNFCSSNIIRLLLDYIIQQIYKMRPYQQVAEVVSKLHNLDSIKESLKKLLVDIDLAKTKGESWIEEKEESSYQEIIQFIAIKTSEILQWLLSITKQYDKRNKNVADKVLHSEELQSINNNVEDLRSNVKLQTKKLQKLQLKLKEQQTLVSTSRELEATFLDFKEQILQELHSASTFMSDLQLKCDLISKEFKEHKELNDDKDKKMAMISQKTETVVKQQEEFSITMGNIMRKMDSLESEQNNIQDHMGDNRRFTEAL